MSTVALLLWCFCLQIYSTTWAVLWFFLCVQLDFTINIRKMLNQTCPELYLAPMAGLTDLPFRELCRQYGCVAGTFVPMIGATALLHKSSRPHTLALLDWKESEQDRQVQIFGSSAVELYQASRLLIELGASGLNLNMGCQMPKIIKNGAGAALLRDLNLAKGAISACVKAADSKVPVTVKLRLGWDSFNTIELLSQLRNLGVSKVFMHGRLASDKFSGPIRVDKLKIAAQSSSVPFYVNGDISDCYSASQMAALPNCCGLMIGRAALGRPFIFAELAAYFAYRAQVGGELAIANKALVAKSRQRPLLLQKIAAVQKHIALAERYTNSDELTTIRRLRRHLSAYNCLSPEIMSAVTFAQLKRLVDAEAESFS